MRIIEGLDNFQSPAEDSVVAIGNFDGMHLGHQRILRFLVSEADRHGLHSLVLTFHPHPRSVLGGQPAPLIQTLNQRLAAMRRFGIRTVIVSEFDSRFSALPARRFIRDILVRTLRAREIIVGENFFFGRNRRGNIATLKSEAHNGGFRVFSCPSVATGDERISSSRIRLLLAEGKVADVRAMLGRPYRIEGTVVRGRHRGKKLGFPTANILTDNEILPRGVFITKARIGRRAYPSLTNIGIRPTFDVGPAVVESFLIDFESDLYGRRVGLDFLDKIRDEIRFGSPQMLSAQVRLDLRAARKYFASSRSSGTP